MSNKEFSQYKIIWVEFSPITGKATKKDIAKIDGIYYNSAFKNGKYYKHFANKESAINFLKTFDKKLSKQYSCKLFTDKQFSNIVNWVVSFTQKQQQEIYYIG